MPRHQAKTAAAKKAYASATAAGKSAKVRISELNANEGRWRSQNNVQASSSEDIRTNAKAKPAQNPAKRSRSIVRHFIGIICFCFQKDEGDQSGVSSEGLLKVL